jgi:predicted MPP superfamily phosphohydrolase
VLKRSQQMSKNTGTGPLRWLHLSDLHFKADEKWDRRTTLAALIRKVKELKEEGHGPDLVFLTGDIAFSGKKAEYDQAFVFLDQLQAATGLEPSKRFYLIPGNHDVDRSLATKQEGRLLLAETQEEIEGLLRHRETMHLLGRRLDAFYAFTERIQGPARGWVPERPWRVDFPEVETGLGSIAVLQLNSAWASGSNDEKHLLVGEMQVREALLESESAALKIALVHHPVSELADFDRARLETLLPAEKVQFLLFGHLHRPRPRVQLTPAGHLVELATGAAYNDDEYPRGFTWGQLDPSGKLEVRLFAYSSEGRGFWVLDNRAFEQAPTGVWTVDLGMPKSAPSKNPSAERTATVAAKYRQAVRQVHGIARFVGFADNRPRPNARVEELFVPLRLKTSGAKEESWTTARLFSWFSKPLKKGCPRAVLLGDPGSGKTTLSRFAAVWFAGGVTVEGATAPKKDLLPLFLPFREYAQTCAKNERSLLDFLKDQAASHLQVNLPEGFLEGEIEKGEAVLLLDGMDEVGDAGARDGMRARVLAFCELFPRLPVLVTSRIAGYDEVPLPGEEREGFRHFRLAAFSDEDLTYFVRNWYTVQEPVDSVARDKGIEELSAAFEVDSRVRELARNPLLATLIALVHRFEAHLPGERAKLYELCIKTLLETWPAARKRRFEEIDEGLQRAYLEDLALRMQEARKKGALREREVVIGMEALCAALVDILLDRNKENVEVVRRRIERWIQHLDQGTGLLIEQRPGIYSFFHLSFLEYLAACALDRGAQQPLDRVIEMTDQPYWREVCLLVVGRKATDKKFLDLLYERLSEKKAWLFLLAGLREEADFDDSQRASILREIGRRLLETSDSMWVTQQTLSQIKEHSLRHAGWVTAWIEEAIRAYRGEELRRIATLCSGNEHMFAQLSRRGDVADAAADLLDFWPGFKIGEWAVLRSSFTATFQWSRSGPAEATLLRSISAFQTRSDGIKTGLLCRLVRSARIGAAIGVKGFDLMVNRKRPGGHGLPRQLVAQPGNHLLCCVPFWFKQFGADDFKAPERDCLYAREIAKATAFDRHEKFSIMLSGGYGWTIARSMFTDFASDFARSLSRCFTPKFASDFALSFAGDRLLPPVDFAVEIVADLFPTAIPEPWRNDRKTPFKRREVAQVDRRNDARENSSGMRLFGLLAGEAWIGLAATIDDDKESSHRYLQTRLQNAWAALIWTRLDTSIVVEDFNGPNLALYLALGWTQATTTYQWPGTTRWKKLLAAPPPAHWLPRSQWHLCWLLHQPESAEHRAAINAAFAEGREDAELPGVAKALVEDLGWGVEGGAKATGPGKRGRRKG